MRLLVLATLILAVYALVAATLGFPTDPDRLKRWVLGGLVVGGVLYGLVGDFLVEEVLPRLLRGVRG